MGDFYYLYAFLQYLNFLQCMVNLISNKLFQILRKAWNIYLFAYHPALSNLNILLYLTPNL